MSGPYLCNSSTFLHIFTVRVDGNIGVLPRDYFNFLEIISHNNYMSPNRDNIVVLINEKNIQAASVHKGYNLPSKCQKFISVSQH